MIRNLFVFCRCRDDTHRIVQVPIVEVNVANDVKTNEYVDYTHWNVVLVDMAYLANQNCILNFHDTMKLFKERISTYTRPDHKTESAPSKEFSMKKEAEKGKEQERIIKKSVKKRKCANGYAYRQSDVILQEKNLESRRTIIVLRR